MLRTFTFHYASIKTDNDEEIDNEVDYIFTFHYASIKTKMWATPASMSLIFTFHYASIKTHSSALNLRI